MHTLVAAGAAFLICVLWFDLMFDVQVRGHYGDIPEAALASISAYYRRVVREAWPMNRLIALVMLLTLVCIGWRVCARFRMPPSSAPARTHRRSKAVSRARSTRTISIASRR